MSSMLLELMRNKTLAFGFRVRETLNAEKKFEEVMLIIESSYAGPEITPLNPRIASTILTPPHFLARRNLIASSP